jgi:Flp pilus assembly protein TadG
MGLLNWFKLNWFQKDPQVKRATRYAGPGLTAFYWDGGLSPGRPIKDVSVSGAYVITAERWYVGTILTTSLKADRVWAADGKPASFTVPCKVVRHGTDGMGVSFVFHNVQEQKMLERFMKTVLGDYSPDDSPRDKKNSAGSSLVEFALLVPLLFVLVAGVADFGGLIFAWITVAHAARTGVQAAVLNGVYMNYVTAPTPASITSTVQSDLAALLNGSSVTPVICEYNNGTLSQTISGTCSTTGPVDSEPIVAGGTPVYNLITVDVTYTYSPFVRTFDFSSLGVHLPALFNSNISIHRRAIMRVI